MYENGDYSSLFPQGAPPPEDSLPLPEDTVALPEPPNIIPGEPLDWDWRNVNGVNYLNDIQDQGSCGSCYAFASTAVAEAVYYRATN